MRYADPTVSFVMKQLSAGLAEFNAKAEAALSQATQIGARSPGVAKQPEASRLHPPKLPAAPFSTGDA